MGGAHWMGGARLRRTEWGRSPLRSKVPVTMGHSEEREGVPRRAPAFGC